AVVLVQAVRGLDFGHFLARGYVDPETALDEPFLLWRGVEQVEPQRIGRKRRRSCALLEQQTLRPRDEDVQHASRAAGMLQPPCSCAASSPSSANSSLSPPASPRPVRYLPFTRKTGTDSMR